MWRIQSVWMWIKKNIVVIFGVLGTIVGFLVGKSLRRDHPDFNELREANNELIRQADDLRAELEKLRNIYSEDTARLQHIESELSNARESLAKLRIVSHGTNEDITGLESNNAKLREWILRYAEEVKHLSGNE